MFPPQSEGLTPREKDILRCILLGLPNKEIARRLGISVATVKRHVRHVLQKMGCPSRAALIAQWVPEQARRVPPREHLANGESLR